MVNPGFPGFKSLDSIKICQIFPSPIGGAVPALSGYIIIVFGGPFFPDLRIEPTKMVRFYGILWNIYNQQIGYYGRMVITK